MNHRLQLAFRCPLRDFDLEINALLAQRITGVFGPSGSGKTSFVECLAGIRQQAKGKIVFGEKVWMDSSTGVRLALTKRNIGYLPQQHLLFPHMRVLQNLRYGESRARSRGLDATGLLNEVIDTLELAPLVQQSVGQLSGGERQRVALGRALCSGPELLILDEPLSSLDVQLRKKILPFLLRVRDHFNIPMLVVSHHPGELMTLCDEILVLKRGIITVKDTPLKVFSHKEVYPDVAHDGFQNLLNGVVETHEAHTSRIRLGEGATAQTAIVMGKEYPKGHSVKLGFSPTDVLISHQPIRGISARNQWKAEVASIDWIGDQVLVMCLLSGVSDNRAMIQLTPDALEELRIMKGTDVYLILKSSAIEMIG